MWFEFDGILPQQLMSNKGCELGPLIAEKGIFLLSQTALSELWQQLSPEDGKQLKWMSDAGQWSCGGSSSIPFTYRYIVPQVE